MSVSIRRYKKIYKTINLMISFNHITIISKYQILIIVYSFIILKTSKKLFGNYLSRMKNDWTRRGFKLYNSRKNVIG